MSFVLEGKKSFWLTTNAYFIEEGRETAWAEKHITYNPAFKWILAKYVEADNPNNNKQFWTLKDLQFGQPSIVHSPMNLLHQPRRIVGAFTAAEMMYPIENADLDSITNPYIETLGVYYKYYFPEELNILERAYAEGNLTISMECVSKSVTCSGSSGCGNEFAYAGPKSSTYCEHLNRGQSIKQLNEPHFLGGGLLVPPIKPGWRQATVKEISELTETYAYECEMAYEGMKDLMPQEDANTWESMMAKLVSAATSDVGEGQSQGTFPARDPKTTSDDDDGLSEYDNVVYNPIKDNHRETHTSN